MARFDVYRLADGLLVLDCQASFLDDIATRFIVPLLPQSEGPRRNPRLNPTFDINGETHVMTTQLATAIRVQELKTRVISLDTEHVRIVSAIDVLTGSG